MAQVVYTSVVRVEQARRPNRRAFLPATPDPVMFGVHGAVAEHYGVTPEEEHATTLDHVVAAAAGWLAGTFAGALEARDIPASDRLVAEARGEVEKEDGVLVIRRIHVRYALRASEQARATIDRVHAMHHRFCPVYRTLSGCIEITTEVALEPESGA